MIIKNGKNFIEIKDKITAGLRDRYNFMQVPKISYDTNGNVTFDTTALTTYEKSPNLFLLANCITRIEEDGVDKTPKTKEVAELLYVLDNDLYDADLISKAINEALKLYGFTSEKNKEKK